MNITENKDHNRSCIILEDLIEKINGGESNLIREEASIGEELTAHHSKKATTIKSLSSLGKVVMHAGIYI